MNNPLSHPCLSVPSVVPFKDISVHQWLNLLFPKTFVFIRVHSWFLFSIITP